MGTVGIDLYYVRLYTAIERDIGARWEGNEITKFLCAGADRAKCWATRSAVRKSRKKKQLVVRRRRSLLDGIRNEMWPRLKRMQLDAIAGCIERRRMAHIYPTATAVLVYLRRFFQPSGQQRTGLCKYNKLDPANGHPTWKKSKNRNKRATYKDIQDGAQRYMR